MEHRKVKYGRTWWKRQRKKNQTPSRPKSCDNDQDMIVLRQWMHKDGYTGCSLKPAVFPDTGRGLMTTRNISPGNILISIPEALLITTDTVLDSDLGQMIANSKMKLKPIQVLVLFLVVERYKGSASQWQHYVDVLPKEYTTPLYFNHDEINSLNDPIKHQATELIDNVAELFKSTQYSIKHLDYKIGTVSLDDILTYDIFKWAWCAVNTRSVYIDHINSDWLDTTTEKNHFALAPYLDLINHTNSAKVEAGFNFENRCYDIKTLDTYKKYDQVFICYNQHSNVKLFLEYGFILPDNDCSIVSVTPSDIYTICKKLSHLGNIKEKLKFLNQKELLVNLEVSLNGASWNLKTCVLILSANTEKNEYSFMKCVYDSSDSCYTTCKMLMKTLLENKIESAGNHDSCRKGFESSEAPLPYKAVIIDTLNGERERILRSNIKMLLTNKEYFLRD
ncbi:unnamed protein product [Owenia fusiformis]|uniref:Uncharacterized protein n=1 Tax=Owenia fusiformis TaxID=6347 RepID=A0A8J1UTD0_OWEFU|nr:unnamed protein product [Owenia fusiformis]